MERFFEFRGWGLGYNEGIVLTSQVSVRTSPETTWVTETHLCAHRPTSREGEIRRSGLADKNRNFLSPAGEGSVAGKGTVDGTKGRSRRTLHLNSSQDPRGPRVRTVCRGGREDRPGRVRVYRTRRVWDLWGGVDSDGRVECRTDDVLRQRFRSGRENEDSKTILLLVSDSDPERHGVSTGRVLFPEL